jgi:nitroreductase
MNDLVNIEKPALGSDSAVQSYRILRAIHERRAIRSFRPEAVPERLVHDLLAAAVRAPTAMRLEPWGFAVVQDKATLQRYSNRAKAALLKSGLAGLGLKEEYVQILENPSYNIFYDASTLIVICRRTAGPFAEADCWLAAENLMLAAPALRLGTCCIGFALAVLNMPEIKHELCIPDEGAAVAPIIVGFPSGTTKLVPRKPPEILRWIPG